MLVPAQVQVPVLGAGFGPQVLLALWWKGATRAGAIAGIATGFGVALGWKWFYNPAATGVEIYNLPEIGRAHV